ncbi:MAG: hypothetical protein DIU66_005340 [Bacillota bacterium]|nr:MAG: hypothetical protein DIU66_02995 [Bacillota bacterium]
MTRQQYLEREREMLLRAYMNASEEEKKEIMLKIVNIDSLYDDKDTYGQRSAGFFTRRRNKIIYVN